LCDFRNVGEDVIERHYKTREVAELLGLHPETIRRAAQRGQLDSVRIGLDRIYPESAIQCWLETNRERAALVPARTNGETRSSTTPREAR
jgi:excisionase family DNA binding protein